MRAIRSFSALLITAALTAAPTLIRAQEGSGHLAYLAAVAYPAQPGYNQQGPGGWDAPPRGYTRDLQRSGFRDGLDGHARTLRTVAGPTLTIAMSFGTIADPSVAPIARRFRQGIAHSGVTRAVRTAAISAFLHAGAGTWYRYRFAFQQACSHAGYGFFRNSRTSCPL